MSSPCPGTIVCCNLLPIGLPTTEPRSSPLSCLARMQNAGSWHRSSMVRQRWERLAANECVSPKHPPVLGGQIDPDDFETCNLLVD